MNSVVHNRRPWSASPWASSNHAHDRTRLSIFRILVIVLVFTSAFFLIKDGLLRPPSATKRFSPPPNRVILSLGTVGGRSDFLADSLPSLFNQTWKVDMVVITVTKADVATFLAALEPWGPFKPDDDRWQIPPNASADLKHAVAGRKIMLGKQGLVVQFLPQDWGPGTKLVGAYLLVGSDVNTAIVTVDDDCAYPPPLVESLVHRMPPDHKGAVCGYCEEPVSLLPGSWMRTDGLLYRNYLYKGHAAECRGWVMGFGGVAYWAGSFEEDLLTYLKGLPEGCFFHDDVWLSGYLHHAGIKRYLAYNIEVPQHFSRHANLSVSSISNTRELHQWPCVKHFNRFKKMPMKKKIIEG